MGQRGGNDTVLAIFGDSCFMYGVFLCMACMLRSKSGKVAFPCWMYNCMPDAL